MTTYSFDASDQRSVNSLIGRVYGYMFFGILLTAAIAFGVGMLFNQWIFGTINTSNIDYNGDIKVCSSTSGEKGTVLAATQVTIAPGEEKEVTLSYVPHEAGSSIVYLLERGSSYHFRYELVKRYDLGLEVR